MAIDGVKDTDTVENGSVLSTGETPKRVVDLNIAEPDDILDGEVKGLSESPVDDDVQKKIRRAERFGVSVKLTEVEKRNSRAERFGTVAVVKGSEGTKKAEELKRKARADRFGVPVPASSSSTKVDNTEEEAKKKARLARFGKDTKVDSAEDDKRKARALRFSKPASDSSSDVPAKLNIAKEAAVSGNAA